MAIHCGVDIIEIERIKKAFQINGEAFLNRVFTDNEIKYCEARKSAKYQSYAARFAAKEAVAKAIGTGISQGISLKDIEVINDEKGRPCVVLHQKAKEIFHQCSGVELSLSISHCMTYAVAYCNLVTRS